MWGGGGSVHLAGDCAVGLTPIFRTAGRFWVMIFGLLTPVHFAFDSYFMGMIFHFLKNWYRFFKYDMSAIQACKTGNKFKYGSFGPCK